MAPDELTGVGSEPMSERMSVRLLPPPPYAIPGTREHGGLKLDWRSEVGQTGSLLRWSPLGRDNDAGVPVEVVRALAAGLGAVCTVTGCTGDVPGAADPAWARVPGGYACRLTRRWWERPRFISLLASEHSHVVARMFEDDAFPWTLEQQVLFLTPPGVLPQLDAALVEACFAVPMRVRASQLTSAGVVGLLVAGVDGDMGGLYMLDSGWRARVTRALAEAVVAAGGRWEAHGADADLAAPAAAHHAAGAR